jgi:meiotically up-regulated gene 157 (Mug157) protein
MKKPSLLIIANVLLVGSGVSALPDARPSADKRTFQSPTIDSLINTLVPLMKDPDLAVLLSNCLPSTLDTTVSYFTPYDDAVAGSALDSFIITGDINALWLRDSANQVIPYLPYGPMDDNLRYLFEGLIARHANSINIGKESTCKNAPDDKSTHHFLFVMYHLKYETFLLS